MRRDIYGVIGTPISHSKSPDIYNYLFEKYSINAVYIPIELDEDNAEFFLNGYLQALNIQGFNVTMPLKEVVANWAKSLDAASKIFMSVNTVDCKKGRGYTTDGKGLLLSLEYQGIDVLGRNVLVLGAGGAARSICHQLSKAGANLTILNRTGKKAQELAKQTDAEADSLDNILAYAPNCDLLINATSMGMSGRDFPDLSFVETLPPHTFVYDIVYNPRKTGLMRAAGNRRTCNGLDMLICQAFYAFEIYTGIMPTAGDRDYLLKLL